jgi:hypothetical protein
LISWAIAGAISGTISETSKNLVAENLGDSYLLFPQAGEPAAERAMPRRWIGELHE